jgi:hypothetical protein
MYGRKPPFRRGSDRQHNRNPTFKEPVFVKANLCPAGRQHGRNTIFKEPVFVKANLRPGKVLKNREGSGKRHWRKPIFKVTVSGKTFLCLTEFRNLGDGQRVTAEFPHLKR